MKAVLQKNNIVFSEHVVVAKTFAKRLVGLMFQSHLPEQEALLIKPCKSIHTFFMQFSIDVLFLSADHEIIDFIKAMPPYRLSPYQKHAASVLEVPAGLIDRFDIQRHDVVRFEA